MKITKEIECVQHLFTYELTNTDRLIIMNMGNGVLKVVPNEPIHETYGCKSFNRNIDGKEDMKRQACAKVGINVRDFYKYFKIVVEKHEMKIVMCEIETYGEIKELYTLFNNDEICGVNKND